jgi:hypothetical protein
MALYEVNEMSPDNRGWHRYQVILVARDGKLAEYRTDLGPKENFKGQRQLNIPSLWEHTVEYLIKLAEELRKDPTDIYLDELLQLEETKFKLV